MAKYEKHLSLRVDGDLLRRFAYVAEYDGRSMNGALLYLIRRYVAKFEAENGKIVFSEDKGQDE